MQPEILPPGTKPSVALCLVDGRLIVTAYTEEFLLLLKEGLIKINLQQPAFQKILRIH